MAENNSFTIGIVGLGLIGGSFAKAYHAAGHKVLAFDTDASILEFAKLSGNVDADLSRENLKDCDLILVCVYPQAAVDFLENEGPYIGTHPIVIDCCGTKRVIVEAGMDAAKRFGFTYVGGHPMAGTQYSGFKHARKDMYKGAPMVIVPPTNDDLDLLMRIKELLSPTGFNSITVSSAEKHDEMIAFTSQLAHVVSSAYIKSPTAKAHKGFSAGSYKDMTRVAWLNPEMWAQLFLDNKDYLADEIDALIENLTAYKEAVAAGDKEALIKLLDEGRRRKEEIDG
ncbi:MAG: prephenate dehydrogenase [Lachnospiraceae bacterium]|nr:prephenate dehydrogenase [Lachnospiraceae bacterium]